MTLDLRLMKSKRVVETVEDCLELEDVRGSKNPCSMGRNMSISTKSIEWVVIAQQKSVV